MSWVVMNKLRVSLGRKIDFNAYIDYRDVQSSPLVPRQSYLGQKVKAEIKLQRGLMTPAEHYPLAEFVNR